jgi:hypothetical protein
MRPKYLHVTKFRIQLYSGPDLVLKPVVVGSEFRRVGPLMFCTKNYSNDGLGPVVS